ncbi:MAG: hypothetical protein CVU84_04575 [Firmicutes bacterium HGW-Firmicutes-1]|jgi:NTE family protein|nr:MAG: hypothetical protein CVU84_04575 [Firmicutes bacterium HGW-Firmicutes-1]
MKYYLCRTDGLETRKHVITPENLVFSGGGIKGIAYLGAIRALEETGVIQGVKRYSGASAGMIIAALLAIGMKEKELYRQMIAIDFKSFLEESRVKIEMLADDPKMLLEPMTSAMVLYDEVVYRGLCDGSYFTKWLIHMFKRKGFDGKTTYKQLYEATGKELHCVLCNLNYGKTVIANHEDTPDMPVVASVRASMSIPFIYRPFEWKEDIYVDGGTMYNYPIEIFDEGCPADNTLGFILSSKNDILTPSRREDKNLWQHIACTYEAVRNVANEYCFRGGNEYRTVFIDHKHINTLDFDLTYEEKEMLIKEGYQATYTYITKGKH